MLGLTNHGHMTASSIQFKAQVNFVGDVMNWNYDVITSISKCLYFNKV